MKSFVAVESAPESSKPGTSSCDLIRRARTRRQVQSVFLTRFNFTETPRT